MNHSKAKPHADARSVADVREFNRFYTRQFGLLDQHLLESPFTLTEARVLYELAQRQSSIATQIAADLGLDPGYLSRILQKFERRGFVKRARLIEDVRRVQLCLTPAGRKTFLPLDRAARRQCFTTKSTGGTAAMRRSLQKSFRMSTSPSIPDARAPGSPRPTSASSARYSPQGLPGGGISTDQGRGPPFVRQGSRRTELGLGLGLVVRVSIRGSSVLNRLPRLFVDLGLERHGQGDCGPQQDQRSLAPVTSVAQSPAFSLASGRIGDEIGVSVQYPWARQLESHIQLQ